MEVAKSSTIGSCPWRGMPTQYGAVDSRFSTPPNGATSSEPAALTKCTDTSPSAAAISAQSPTRPIWPALRSATADSPAFLHFSMPIRTACGVTVWPYPNLPSTTASDGVSTTISAVWLGTTEPVFFQRTYTGTRITPWLSCPVRLAVVRYVAMRLASSGEDSECENTSATKLMRLGTCRVTMNG